ncbi:MAG: BON domain-containing protein [Aquidulcibacter sp.]|jgi:osmotically-inducible protein OsmY|uniref:BON domain-containing protein n=1 Tax=Aquidulcibacter sp. TaxID=2052990 RepID=UPI0022C7975D|nr:BON domain-containing protein [Aquidulcibacter sp.]
MKSDSKLQKDVMDELDWEPKVDHAHIGVSAQDGVVTLSGHVNTYSAKLAAEEATRRVKGVRGIAEEIEVRLPSQPKTADEEIAKRILDLFDWNVLIPSDKITVKVEHGWVTLGGKVDFHFQRQAAKEAASRIGGVKAVADTISVKSAASSFDIRNRIVAALERSADLDADTITVSADGDTVKLSGKVHSSYERRLAESAAWAAPGVNRVENNIVVVF